MLDFLGPSLLLCIFVWWHNFPCLKAVIIHGRHIFACICHSTTSENTLLAYYIDFACILHYSSNSASFPLASERNILHPAGLLSSIAFPVFQWNCTHFDYHTTWFWLSQNWEKTSSFPTTLIWIKQSHTFGAVGCAGDGFKFPVQFCLSLIAHTTDHRPWGFGDKTSRPGWL